MATWNASQALREVNQFLQGDPWSLFFFETHAYMEMFGHWRRRDGSLWQLSPSRDMLAIRLWSPCTFSKNLRIAMLMEAVGQGPQRYCIVCDFLPGAYKLLKYILYVLPHERMFLYPIGATLGGPFLHEPWLSRAQALQARPSITKEEYEANFESW